ncbi:MAG TPA: anti-sigma factor [Acidimicrobiales bacterium]|nr:anti-sigma factor [Acidimicrobiales bacterium]
MTGHFSHDDIRDLLAVYALDAVDADEAEAIDAHLPTCPRCRSEVADYREAASALATAHEPVPLQLWDDLAAQLVTAPPTQLAPVALRRSPAPRRPWIQAAIGLAALLVALLGVRVVQQGQRIDGMQAALEDRTVLAAALAAHEDPHARKTELRSKHGVVLAHAVVVPDGTGYLSTEALPAINSQRTYQLWAIIGTERISAGLLGSSPKVAPFRVAGNIVGFAITEEVAGGVVASENQPVASGLVVDA